MLLWLVLQWILQVIFGIWLRYRARHEERLPAQGGGVLVSNHQSFLDPLLIGLPLSRPISFMARDSLFRIPLLGPFLRYTYVIPISRRSASAKLASGASPPVAVALPLRRRESAFAYAWRSASCQRAMTT